MSSVSRLRPEGPFIDWAGLLSGKNGVVSGVDRRLIANTPVAPALARRYVGERLAGLSGEAVDAAALMVSELATNCVRHTTAEFTVSVEHTDRGVRVDVADGGAGGAAMREPEPSDPCGRGLKIVDRLSDAWGVQEVEGRVGHHVWFELRTQSDG